jgi:hypothetical protein
MITGLGASASCQKTCTGGYVLCAASSECPPGKTCGASPFGQKYCQ